MNIEKNSRLNLLPEEKNDPNELFEHFRFVIDKGQTPIRIDKYLSNVMSNTSRSRIQEAASQKAILVNDKAVKSNYKVKPNDVISIVLQYPPTEFEIIPQDIPIDVVYEDEELMVVNKQPGIVVHPGVGNYDNTLLNAIAYHLKDDERFDINDPNLGLVHRIDKDTSGLLVIAKTYNAKAKLAKQFFDKTTHRIYQTVVWGRLTEDNGTITGDLARDPKDRMLFKVFKEGENPNAKHAITHYRVLNRMTFVSLVECQLETGRTHQIRVHMKHIGHTLFNDERYGGNLVLKGNRTTKYKQFIKNCFEICPRQALHAKTLGFVHPTTEQEMLFESELPKDMECLISKWEGYSNTIK